MAFLPAALGIGSILAPLIFGGGSEQKQVTETEIPPAGFQDPMLPVMSPAILQMLLQNLQSWGAPSGPKGTVGTFQSPMIQDMMRMIGMEWPKIMKGAQAPGGGELGGFADTASRALGPRVRDRRPSTEARKASLPSLGGG